MFLVGFQLSTTAMNRAFSADGLEMSGCPGALPQAADEGAPLALSKYRSDTRRFPQSTACGGISHPATQTTFRIEISLDRGDKSKYVSRRSEESLAGIQSRWNGPSPGSPLELRFHPTTQGAI